MIKKIGVIFAAVLICISVAFSASAYTNQYIVDDAGNLDYDDYESLSTFAERIEQDYGTCFMFGIVDGTDGMTDEEYAEQTYTDNTDNENGMIILHNDEEDTYAVFVSGNLKEYFNEAAIDSMIETYDTNESFYGGIENYYRLANIYLENGGTVYNTDEEPEAEDTITTGRESDEKDGVGIIWIPVSLGIGLLIGFLIINSIASKNKSVKMQENATVYTRPGSMVITGSADNFLYNNVERREKPKQTENQKN